MTLTPLLQSSFVIQLHVAAAIAAMLLGAIVLFRPKGTRRHKLMGRIWIVLMLVVATTSLFISEIRLIGPFSPIHLFSILTYASVAQGIWFIRRGNVVAHRATMTSLYFGALILTGAFTLLPGRRMHEVLFGAETGWVPSLIAIGIAIVLTFALWLRLLSRGAVRP
ncbi:MAG: hypothetical protein JWR75_2107 [Devosia sp.]|nr:hypothetical protein [Devosia sp.]